MNRNTADRIIVTSNARMERVLDWYFDNFKWLDREKFLAPMDSGVVELCEEQIEFTFESKGSWVEMAVYITVKPNLPPVVMFDYDPATTEIRNRRKVLPLDAINDVLMSCERGSGTEPYIHRSLSALRSLTALRAHGSVFMSM